MSELPRSKRLARASGVGYVGALVLLAFLFRFVGERNWLVTVLMYLPRIGWLLPLPFVLGLHLVARDQARAVAVTVTSVLLVAFPLMGWKVFGRDEDAMKSMRVMSWNTYFGRIDNEAIRKKVADEKPDVFVAQGTAHRTKELFRADTAGYVLESDDEFFLATRFPVVDKYAPPPFEDDPNHKPSWVRYTLDTPLGRVDLFSVHPRSPRSGMEGLRGQGFKARILAGDLPEDAGESVAKNTKLRRRQIESVVAAMRSSQNPILLAGDTNLPTLSWLFHDAFGALHDGFADAGRGLGYTFPAKRPWMRIDRILADKTFRFLRFWTGSVIASDHLYVVAELTRGEP